MYIPQVRTSSLSRLNLHMPRQQGFCGHRNWGMLGVKDEAVARLPDVPEDDQHHFEADLSGKVEIRTNAGGITLSTGNNRDIERTPDSPGIRTLNKDVVTRLQSFAASGAH